MNRFFLKQYYPIFKAENKLCIGIPWGNDYLEVNYNENNYKKIEELIINGIDKGEILLHKEIRTLYKKNMLSEYSKINNSNNIRLELFLQYLGVNKTVEDFYEKKILVFGAGAGGSTLLFMLAQIGFKKLYVVDDDLVDKFDLFKTLIYRKNSIGELKVESLKKVIKSNFNINIKGYRAKPINYEDINNFINDIKPDFIVKACDPSLSFRYNLNKLCFEKKIPFIYMSYAFERINVGPLFIPGVTLSDLELEKYYMKIKGKHYAFKKHEKLFSKEIIHPSVTFNVNILASLILKEILFYFLETPEFSLSINKEVFFIPLNYKVFYRDLSKLN